jgi:hypothetical protein
MNAAPETKAADTPARMPANNPKRYGQTTVSNDRLQPKNGELPPFLKDMISAPPRSGGGFHTWMFSVSRQLHAHRDESEIFALLSAIAFDCGRHVPDSEIIAAIRDAWHCRYQPSGGMTSTASKPAPKWPTVDEAKRRAAIEAAGCDLADLWDASPTICTLDSVDAEFFADQLFPGNPLLCVGRSMSDFRTAPREEFRGMLGDMSLIVPSPMSALTGTRKSDGKPSAHTLANTGPRRFLVTEFDSGTRDEQAALIWHLRQFAPLAVVLTSGGKSLHAWWNCREAGEALAGRFFRYAVSLGADHATWTRSQFVRLPQGWRADKERRQEVYFFDHEAAQGTEVKP